jgi:hypothetical protein
MQVACRECKREGESCRIATVRFGNSGGPSGPEVSPPSPFSLLPRAPDHSPNFLAVARAPARSMLLSAHS